MMSNRRLRWPFWVGVVWIVGIMVYSVFQWLGHAQEPPVWLSMALVMPIFLCMWYHSILSANDEAGYQESLIKAEVESAVRKALKPHKMARVVETEAETIGDE